MRPDQTAAVSGGSPPSRDEELSGQSPFVLPSPEPTGEVCLPGVRGSDTLPSEPPASPQRQVPVITSTTTTGPAPEVVKPLTYKEREAMGVWERALKRQEKRLSVRKIRDVLVYISGGLEEGEAVVAAGVSKDAWGHFLAARGKLWGQAVEKAKALRLWELLKRMDKERNKRGWQEMAWKVERLYPRFQLRRGQVGVGVTINNECLPPLMFDVLREDVRGGRYGLGRERAQLREGCDGQGDGDGNGLEVLQGEEMGRERVRRNGGDRDGDDNNNGGKEKGMGE